MRFWRNWLRTAATGDYFDTSVALAHLLAEDRQPPASLWSETLALALLYATAPVLVGTCIRDPTVTQ